MKIIEEVAVSLSWADLDALTWHERPRHVRSAGVHVSQVINWLAGPEGLGLYKERDASDVDADMPLGVLLGMGWEVVGAALYPEMIWQPGELKLDGLIGSPDGFSEIDVPFGMAVPDAMSYKPTVSVIDEFKRTLKSRFKNADVRENWPWMSQCMAYCKMDTKRNPQLVRLHVDWDAGDYRPPRAEYRRYLIRFERVEIEKNWQLLIKHRDRVTPETGGGR